MVILALNVVNGPNKCLISTTAVFAVHKDTYNPRESVDRERSEEIEQGQGPR